MLVLFLCLVLQSVVGVKLRVGLLMSDDAEVSSLSSYSFTLLPLKSSSFEVDIEELQLDLVYDLSNSQLKSHAVSMLAKRNGFVQVVEWSEDFSYKVGALYPHLSRAAQLEAGVATLKALSIEEVVFLTDEFTASDKFKENFEVVAAAVVVEETPQTSLDKIATRTFKSEGVRTLVVDLPGDLTDMAFTSFDRAHMMKEGYVVICSPHTSWLDPKSKFQGPLLLLEEGTETAASLLESKLLSLDWAIKQVANVSGCSINMKACLAAAFARRKLKLLNLLGGSRTEVGEVFQSQVVLTKQIFFPGNMTTFDPTTAVEIKVTTISSSKTQYGSDPGNSDVFKGFFVALEEATVNQVLGRFYLKSREIECGASGYQPDFARACVEREQNDLGVAIFSSYSSGATKGVLEAMQALNLTQPVIGSLSTASFLSSKAVWPNFMRTIKISSSTIPGFVQFMLKYGYTQTHLFYSDEVYGQDYYQAMLKGLSASNIEVVNPESERAITEDFIANPSDYMHVGQSVINSGVRPLFMVSLMQHRVALVDLLYKAGLRTNDLVLGFDSQYTTMWEDDDPEVLANRLTLMLNTFNFEHSAFSGPVGNSAQTAIQNFLGSPAYSGHCQYYDSCYLLVYALKTMIRRGKDFEDTAAMNFQLRDTAFYGCTGRVSVDKDSNDRRDQDTDVFNLREVEGQYSGILVLRVSVTSTQMFTQFNDPIWPGNKTTAPQLNRLNYEDCPFPEEYRHDFEKGKVLVLYLCLGYFGFTCLIAVLLLLTRKLKNSVEMMTEKVQVTFQDRVVLLLVLVDFLQYIGHGPVLKNNQDAIQNLIDYASAGTLGAIDFNKEGVYKTVLNSILSLVLVWFIFSFLIWMKFRGIRIRCCELLTTLGEAVMPLLGNALFLPITSVLFDIFICEEAHGPIQSELDYSDSFMFRDCNEDCWGGLHLRYVIAVSIALVLYHPITIITRPLWQELIPDMHLKTRQTFYLQKSLVEVILVGIRRGLRSRSRLVHGGVYIAVIFIHLILCIMCKPFNYQRLNLWFSLSMFMVIIISTTSLIEDNISGFTGPHAIGLMFGVGGFLLLLGLLLQFSLFPSLLQDKKHQNLQELFRFGFDLRNIKPPEFLKHRPSFVTDEEHKGPTELHSKAD
jgi:ABC-type branched-subunit amino acid transport system substrate-binding protein